jgi:hypothetical protein
VRNNKRPKQLLLLDSLYGTKDGRDICCSTDLFERAVFPTVCVSTDEQLVTRVAKYTITTVILYGINVNVKHGMKV